MLEDSNKNKEKGIEGIHIPKFLDRAPQWINILDPDDKMMNNNSNKEEEKKMKEEIK